MPACSVSEVPAAPIITLMMEAGSTSEILVNFYQTTQCYNSEDSHLLCLIFLHSSPPPLIQQFSQACVLSDLHLYLTQLFFLQLTNCPDDGGCMYLWNAGQFVPDYIAQHSRSHLHTSLWEPETSPVSWHFVQSCQMCNFHALQLSKISPKTLDSVNNRGLLSIKRLGCLQKKFVNGLLIASDKELGETCITKLCCRPSQCWKTPPLDVIF
jgi:hypothetical protein